MEYSEFLESKAQSDKYEGFDPVFMPDSAFDFQQYLIDWSLRKGRAANFDDCGLGKTLMQLVVAENIVRKRNKAVLLLTPLAVSQQTIKEASKFGMEARKAIPGEIWKGINVTNYEQLHKFDFNNFSGVICDESSILKNFNGSTKALITDFMRKVEYRFLYTATAAPNDHIEFGTSSEALGGLGYIDMLNKFFKNDQNNSAQGRIHGQMIKWRLKGHAEEAFWKWICAWAKAIRKPSDIGFDDTRFILPELIEREIVVKSDHINDGELFHTVACGLFEQRKEAKRLLNDRCETAANLVNDSGKPAIVWCHRNDEGDLLEKLIPDCQQVSGRDKDESKEEKFNDFVAGKTRVLVTKPKIGAWGLNFQHCAHEVFFPSHSYEQYYQGVRRCWRFGQEKAVTVDVVATEGEVGIMKNLQRKSNQADEMFANLVREMNQGSNLKRSSYKSNKVELPSWIK
jgi:hypothetical protein